MEVAEVVSSNAPHGADGDEVVIWYRPRIRAWLDNQGEYHLAGEPDGLVRLLDAMRLVVRGLEDEAAVELRTDPIEKDRNPVRDRGVRQIFERIVVRRDPNALQLRSEIEERRLIVYVGERTKAIFGFALVEAIDGEGDFHVPISAGEVSARLWFWGYSNPHGVNTF